MIKNIILDMGNVLIEYDVNRPLDALCPNEESKKIIRRELFESEDWLEGDRGNITDAQMLAAAKARVPEKYHAALEKCERHWPDFLNRIDARRSSAARCVRAGRIYMSSQTRAGASMNIFRAFTIWTFSTAWSSRAICIS